MRSLGPDRPLLIVTVLLVLFGLLMLYSAGQTDMPVLAAMASGIVAEEQALRRPVTVVITPIEPGIEDVGTADEQRSVKDQVRERPLRLAAVPAGPARHERATPQ